MLKLLNLLTELLQMKHGWLIVREHTTWHVPAPIRFLTQWAQHLFQNVHLDECYHKTFFFFTVYVVSHYTPNMYDRGLQKPRTLTGVPIGHEAEAIRIS